MIRGLTHLTKISDFSKETILEILDLAKDMKANPDKYRETMKHKTLLMLFEKPSLRTRVSFEVGMTQMGGHAIFYSIADSPLGKKESISDLGKVVSRYCEVIMARVMKRSDIKALADCCTIPVINALDDFAHPCQMLADLLTIYEKGKFDVPDMSKVKMTYLGDIHNNVTYDLMRSAAVLGFHIRVAGPEGEGFEVEQCVLDECAELCKVSGGKVEVFHDAKIAIDDADIVYTDSWMSYGIPESEKQRRIDAFGPFQVTEELMKLAKPDAIFMNCLPALRGMEQTAEVVDGPQSVVFDEAENRLHAQKALVKLLVDANSK
eukprot:TRINITY_DN82745_c0_g1_i1.p1 TRINITY_DN82745_c0_g1~~TRINITY_DN82745_c0_g1_i1.p1  ORF type:complete len:320 (+),score=85.33 TRINITY_DN82745_c0_g1_i1:92-1051(+)